MNVAFLLGERAVITLSEKTRNEQAFDSRAEPFLLLQLLSNHNPQNNYYVVDYVGYLNKYTKEQYIKDFPNQNVYFPVNPYVERIKALGPLKDNFQCTKMSKEAKEILDEMVDYLMNEIKLEYGISFYTFNKQGIPGISRKLTKPEELAKLRISDARSKYGVYFLNKSKLPYLTYLVDMRYIKKSTTLTTAPKVIAGFKNGIETITMIEDTTFEAYKNHVFIDHNIPIRYVYTDTLLTVGMLKDIDNKIPKEKDINLITFYNQQNLGIDRTQFLVDFGLFKEFNQEELKVYANLKRYNKVPEDYNINGHKTQLTVPYKEMIELMKRSKYTLIIPNDIITNTSSKPWENMFTGTIPFMADTNTARFGNKEWREMHKLPDFFFVKDAKELKEKINILENNKELYNYYRQYMKNTIDNILTGKPLVNAIDNIIQEYLLD